MRFDDMADILGEEAAACLIGFSLAEKPDRILGYLELLDMELNGCFSERIPDPDSPLFQKWKRRAVEMAMYQEYDTTDVEAALHHVEDILENWNK